MTLGSLWYPPIAQPRESMMQRLAAWIAVSVKPS